MLKGKDKSVISELLVSTSKTNLQVDEISHALCQPILRHAVHTLQTLLTAQLCMSVTASHNQGKERRALVSSEGPV